MTRSDSGGESAAHPGTSGSAAPTTTTLTLDPNHAYGDEFADGILPVGDNRYSTAAPSTGSVYVCRAPQGGGGAQARGPWFVSLAEGLLTCAHT